MTLAKPRCGFELEYNFPYGISYKLLEGIVSTSWYDTGWRLDEECSTDNCCGTEIISPILQRPLQVHRQWEKIWNKLQSPMAGKEVITNNTGFHVHVCRKNYTEEQLQSFFLSYIQVEDLFFLPWPEREAMRWCRPLSRYLVRRMPIPFVRHEAIKALSSMIKQDPKYFFDEIKSKGSAVAYRTTVDTIEFRMAKSTTDIDIALQWVATCRNFVHTFTRKQLQNREEFFDMFPKGKLKTLFEEKYHATTPSIHSL